MGKIKTVDEALKWLHGSIGRGYRDDLLQLFEKDVIESLALRGYISNGVTADDDSEGKYKRTWSITRKAITYYECFLDEPSAEEQEFGRYLYSIGVR